MILLVANNKRGGMKMSDNDKNLTSDGQDVQDANGIGNTELRERRERRRAINVARRQRKTGSRQAQKCVRQDVIQPRNEEIERLYDALHTARAVVRQITRILAEKSAIGWVSIITRGCPCHCDSKASNAAIEPMAYNLRVNYEDMLFWAEYDTRTNEIGFLCYPPNSDDGVAKAVKLTPQEEISFSNEDDTHTLCLFLTKQEADGWLNLNLG